jgi:hypothetical protein
MLKDELCEKLNKLIDRSARYYGVNYNMPMKFSCGNRFDLLTATINEVAPYLKGAYLTTKLEFEKEGVKINNAVLKAGAKVVNVVIEDEIEDKVICYRFDETTKAMVQFMLEGEDNDITLTDSYMVIKDVQNGTYTLYNKKGVALLKTQGHSDVQQSGEMNVVELDGYLYIQAEINKNPVIYLVD